MILETKRLILRKYTYDDFNDLSEILTDSETMKYYPRPYDSNGVKKWLEWSINNYEKYGFGLWAIVLKENNEFIGDCGITIQNINGEKLPEIGYHINKKYWQKGYAKEAARAVRDWAFRNLQYESLYSYMNVCNVPSYKTASSIGMKRINQYHDGEENLYVYSITKEEWEKHISRKEKYKNVYFINGTAYAGKSTICKLLADKYSGIHCVENYHDQLSDTLDPTVFPALTYTRDLLDFRHFIRRTPDVYEKWIKDVTKECTILELKILDELVKSDKLIFVDTNIPVDILSEISDVDHVLIMLTDPYISVNRFFERPDKEKQYLYQLLMTEDNPEFAMENFKECLKRVNNEDIYNMYLNSGFNTLIKDEERKIEDTLKLVETLFKL